MRKFTYDSTWRFGANFTPATAINQLEMWQQDSFDPATIDRDLGWAEAIGMRVMRVFLHDLLYQQDPAGFLDRMERYLSIAARHQIKTMFVFFDDCWAGDFALGKQPAPKPMTHNSGWVQSPGYRVVDDPAQWGRLEEYVTAVLRRFSGDSRILLWDLYNEPGNGSSGNHISSVGLRGSSSLPLLKAVFEWAAKANPGQPVTVGPWRFDAAFDELNRFMYEKSEVVSFHSYNPPAVLEEKINFIRYIADGRPLLCSEYMARTAGSTFAECLPLLQKHQITAINWGLVSGKTNTIYPWGWNAEKGVPPQWFHDVFQADGALLYPEEGKTFAEVTAR